MVYNPTGIVLVAKLLVNAKANRNSVYAPIKLKINAAPIPGKESNIIILNKEAMREQPYIKPASSISLGIEQK